MPQSPIHPPLLSLSAFCIIIRTDKFKDFFQNAFGNLTGINVGTGNISLQYSGMPCIVFEICVLELPFKIISCAIINEV